MSTCKSCGSSVPEGQNFCSMCYGDIDYGRDGYYREYMESWEREAEEREAAREAWRLMGAKVREK